MTLLRFNVLAWDNLEHSKKKQTQVSTLQIDARNFLV